MGRVNELVTATPRQQDKTNPLIFLPLICTFLVLNIQSHTHTEGWLRYWGKKYASIRPLVLLEWSSSENGMKWWIQFLTEFLWFDRNEGSCIWISLSGLRYLIFPSTPLFSLHQQLKFQSWIIPFSLQVPLRITLLLFGRGLGNGEEPGHWSQDSV